MFDRGLTFLSFGRMIRGVFVDPLQSTAISARIEHFVSRFKLLKVF